MDPTDLGTGSPATPDDQMSDATPDELAAWFGDDVPPGDDAPPDGDGAPDDATDMTDDQTDATSTRPDPWKGQTREQAIAVAVAREAEITALKAQLATAAPQTPAPAQTAGNVPYEQRPEYPDFLQRYNREVEKFRLYTGYEPTEEQANGIARMQWQEAEGAHADRQRVAQAEQSQAPLIIGGDARAIFTADPLPGVTADEVATEVAKRATVQEWRNANAEGRQAFVDMVAGQILKAKSKGKAPAAAATAPPAKAAPGVVTNRASGSSATAAPMTAEVRAIMATFNVDAKAAQAILGGK